MNKLFTSYLSVPQAAALPSDVPHAAALPSDVPQAAALPSDVPHAAALPVATLLFHAARFTNAIFLSSFLE